MEVRDAALQYAPQVDIPVAPEGYKQTEMGVIPEDWDAVLLSELGQFKNGINKGSDDFGHGSPFINLMDVFGVNSIKSDDPIGLVKTSAAEQKTYDLKRGDVLFIRSSVKPSGVGLTAVVESDLPQTVYSGFLIRFRDNGMLDIGFKRHCFSSERFRRNLIGTSTVSANTNINQDNLKKLVLALPSTVREQRAIATALSNVDTLLEALDRLIAKKRDIKQATMQQLLTAQTRLPGFEGAWKRVRLGDHVTFLKNGVNSRAELLSDGQVRYLHYGDIHASGSVLKNPDSLPFLPDAKAKSLARLQNGDLVFADASEDIEGVGKSVELVGIASTEVVSGLHTIAARFDKAILSDGFKAYLQFCPEFISTLRRLAAGTKVYATTRSHIAGVEMRLPKVEEQQVISRVFSAMDTELEALQQRRTKTAALKQAMMQELLTGRTRLV